MGRPSDYKPEYCELVIEEMRHGKCLREFTALVKSTSKTVYSWMDKHPDFLNAVEIGRNLSYKWWVEQGRNGLFDTSTVETGPDGTVTKSFAKINSRIYELFMHNMFDWSKKQSVEAQNTTSLNVSSAEDSKALTEKISQAFRAKAEFDKDGPAKGNA